MPNYETALVLFWFKSEALFHVFWLVSSRLQTDFVDELAKIEGQNNSQYIAFFFIHPGREKPKPCIRHASSVTFWRKMPDAQ